MSEIQRPKGYREPTEEEKECLPEGGLVYAAEANQWLPSLCLKQGVNPSLHYAVPITELSAVPTLGADPTATQVGGDHYRGFKIQPAEFITANGIGFLEGCVIKRMCRHGAKNKAEDIRKAIHELQLILKLTYNETP